MYGYETIRLSGISLETPATSCIMKVINWPAPQCWGISVVYGVIYQDLLRLLLRSAILRPLQSQATTDGGWLCLPRILTGCGYAEVQVAFDRSFEVHRTIVAQEHLTISRQNLCISNWQSHLGLYRQLILPAKFPSNRPSSIDGKPTPIYPSLMLQIKSTFAMIFSYLQLPASAEARKVWWLFGYCCGKRTESAGSMMHRKGVIAAASDGLLTDEESSAESGLLCRYHSVKQPKKTQVLIGVIHGQSFSWPSFVGLSTYIFAKTIDSLQYEVAVLGIRPQALVVISGESLFDLSAQQPRKFAVPCYGATPLPTSSCAKQPQRHQAQPPPNEPRRPSHDLSMSAKGLSVSIVTPLHDPFRSYPAIAAPDPTAEEATTYILSSLDADSNNEVQTEPFEIHVKAEPWLVFERGIGYQFMLYLKKGQLLQTCWIDADHRHGVIKEQCVRELGGGWGRRGFVFTGLKVSEEEGLKSLPPDVAGGIGMVELKVKRVYSPAYNHTRQNMLYESVHNTTFFDNSREHAAGGLASTINEKALKGNGARHQATLGAGMPSIEPPQAPPFSYVDQDPYHTFTFLYRTKSILESLGIIPAAPAPLPIPDSLFDEPQLRPRLSQTALWVNSQQELNKLRRSLQREGTVRARSEETIAEFPKKGIVKAEPRDEREDSMTVGGSVYGGTGRKRKSQWYEFNEEKRYRDDDGEIEEVAPPKKNPPVWVVLDDVDEENEDGTETGNSKKDDRQSQIQDGSDEDDEQSQEQQEERDTYQKQQERHVQPGPEVEYYNRRSQTAMPPPITYGRRSTPANQNHYQHQRTQQISATYSNSDTYLSQ
ncbi:hypothetical protein BJ508DRAFT_377265 [Ascobolus immersus RN42]|uniref:DUF7918 domain-containing protein n=1 Tax=Ascobolus immersus RN42 TaxID=1160509 RepID=A0A3N4I3I6_ASCIM|nr:hypothetical protein BJ508DRAFT_377265 [Ascobolus immersus RN42]